MEPAEAFGATLRELRTAHGVSQERLALEVELDRTYISMLERGLRQPTLSTLIALADFLGLTPGSLVDRTMTRMRKGTKR